MSGDERTDFDLSITIPNTKSRSNMKYSANYVRLSEYMNLDERLENAIKNQTKIIQDHRVLNHHFQEQCNLICCVDLTI